MPKEIALSYIKEEFKNPLLVTTVFDRLITEFLSIVFLLAFLPVNMWLMSEGYYGKLPNYFENPTSIIFKALFTSPLNILALILGVVVVVRTILTNKNRYRVITTRYLVTEKILVSIPANLLALVYFVYHGVHRYIALGVLVQTTLTAAVYILTRVFTTKTLD